MTRDELADAAERAVRDGSATARQRVDVAITHLVDATERSAREAWAQVDRLKAELREAEEMMRHLTERDHRTQEERDRAIEALRRAWVSAGPQERALPAWSLAARVLGETP